MQELVAWKYLVDKDRYVGVAKRGRDLLPWRICFFSRGRGLEGAYLMTCEMLPQYKFRSSEEAQEYLDSQADKRGWRLYLPEYEAMCSENPESVPVDDKNKTPKQRIRARFGKSLTAVAREYGVSASSVVSRLDRGWDIEKALTTPIANKNQRRNPKWTQGGLAE